MAKCVIIQHPVTKITKDGFYGFSWTGLFFGWCVPLFRGELADAALHLLFWCISFGTWNFVMAFVYNKQYMIRMLEKGYVLKDDERRMMDARAAIGIADF